MKYFTIIIHVIIILYHQLTLFMLNLCRELSFNKDEIVYITRQIDNNWYEGERHGKVGIFPISYVEVCDIHAKPEPMSVPVWNLGMQINSLCFLCCLCVLLLSENLSIRQTSACKAPSSCPEHRDWGSCGSLQLQR